MGACLGWGWGEGVVWGGRGRLDAKPAMRRMSSRQFSGEGKGDQPRHRSCVPRLTCRSCPPHSTPPRGFAC